MKYFEETLSKSLMMQNIDRAEKEKAFPIQLNGCVDTQICHMMMLLGRRYQTRLIVTYNEDRAKKLYDDYRSFDRDVLYYPAKDALFFSADVHGGVTQNQRLEVIRELLLQKNNQSLRKSVTVVTTVEGVLDRLLPLFVMEKFMISVKAEQELVLSEFSKELVDLGYENVHMVEQPGQYSVRGGILDIFPMGEEAPYRIEFWGDEVDTIRSFDVESQRSIEQMDEILLFPATELPLSAELLEKGQREIEAEYDILRNEYMRQQKNKEAYNLKYAVSKVMDELSTYRLGAGIDSFITYFYSDTVSLLDYFAGDNAAVFYDEPSWIKESLSESEEEFNSSMQGRLDYGYILPRQCDVYFSEEVIHEKMKKSNCYYFSKIGYVEPAFSPNTIQEIHAQRTNTYQNHFEMLVQDMRRWQREEYRVVLLSSSSTRGKRLSKELSEEGLTAYYADEMSAEVLAGQTCVTTGTLSCGFTYPEEKIVILSEDDVIRQKGKRRTKRPRFKGEVIKSFDDLSIGDYVVHEDRGVGIYRGIVQKEIDDNIRDYIAIEYAEGAMFYTHISGMDKVQRYAGKEARRPKLNKLGGKEWEKTKSRVKGQVGLLAKELITLYAIRQEKHGFACEKDTVWQTEFEEMFPYDETEDQLKAIEDTKRDMESNKIMDRLICGDVGYGKTEVALRAAFKAVNNSKQVVYLVPTTVLAQQHFQTFTERMKDYPITVKMLSRFCTAKEQKEVISGLRKGEVDIVIGTHRVFSKDVCYKDLGLLIVDEEQRFGVSHKERIKQMKKEIDVLTLTATPIPRTLHMSLAGIRDMSLLNEAPVNRRAIQTYVMEYNEELVKEAVKREIARGGQVYYVYNRIKNIEEIAMELKKLVPAARIAYGHGQMGEHELERIMMDFVAGKIDVLVSTTIIETGIDIPNVNTIIIHDADKFGLAQLYQLRGRVGRSSRRAFAFLLYRRDKLIKETAEKRLAAIREFTDLGSGFKIAMRDLEIRGAGNVLGEDQSGHMEAVGYDLYCKMLNEAIASMKGETMAAAVDTSVDVDLTAYIPVEYVRNEFQKLELYKRIAGIETRDDLEDMADELIDRYGEPPEEVKNLLEVALLKNTARRCYITHVRQVEGSITVNVYGKAPVDINKLDKMLKEAVIRREKVTFTNEKEPAFNFKTGHLKKEDIMTRLWNVVDRIGLLMDEE